MFPSCHRTPNHASEIAAIRPPKMSSRPSTLFPVMVIVCSDKILTSPAEKCRYPLYHILLLFLCEFRIDRQSQRFFRRSFCLGKIALLVAEICKTFLKVKRDGIINVSPDAGRSEELPQLVPHFRNADNKLIVYMSDV